MKGYKMVKKAPLDIESNIRDLIRDVPRLGFTIMKMRVEFASKERCKTAQIRRDFRVQLNKEYMESLTPLERIAILKHEAMHVIHRHWDRLVGVSQPHIARTAEEIQINQHIDNLPKGCLIPEMYNVPRGKSLEEYYTLLLAKAKQNPASFKIKYDNNPLKDDTDQLQDVDVVEAETLCKEAEAYDKAVGIDSGDMYEKIEKVPTNYRAKIRKFIGCQPCTTSIRRSNAKRSNRYPKSPGIKFNLRMGDAIFGLDTSGSMTAEELGQSVDCANKVSHLCKNLIFIQCDSQVHDVNKKMKKNIQTLEVKGRGGTDLEPIFEKAKEYGYPKLPLIVFTDGELWNWPSLADMKNSVWIITNKDRAKSFHQQFPSIDYAVLL